MLKSFVLICVSFLFFVSCGEDNPVDVIIPEANYLISKNVDGSLLLLPVILPNTQKLLSEEEIIKNIDLKKCQINLKNNNNEIITTKNKYIVLNSKNVLEVIYENIYNNKVVIYKLNIDSKTFANSNDKYIDLQINYIIDNQEKPLIENELLMAEFLSKAKSIKFY
jgi:hypothetical protein